ncbi:MAG: aminotransferase class IV family protein [Rhizobiaceae bacterium]
MPFEGPLRDRLGPGDRLIETLGYRPGRGVRRLGLHLDRMERSADALGFAFDRSKAETALARAATGESPLRLRLTLNADGAFETASSPFAPTPPDVVWRVAVAHTQLDSADPLLAHKTTRRAPYDAARAEFGVGIDEVILLNERDQVCEGTIANIFLDDGGGTLRTPGLECGLLPGVRRAEMLAAGQAREAIVSIDDLRAARALFVGNSLRGLIRAELTG